MKSYDATTEQTMRKFHGTLSEKDKRRYAAIEALKLGHGGGVYIAAVLGCHRVTIAQGIKELAALPQSPVCECHVREQGGGRKPYDTTHREIDAAFLSVLQNDTAGDPMDDQVRWTHLLPKEIALRLADEHQIKVSLPVIRKLLKKNGYRRRKAQKKPA